jgi:hypothetical protein
VPSYRAILGIGALRGGVQPPTLLPAVAESVAALTTVEAQSVELVAGEPRIVIRFTADDAEHALRIAAEADVTAGALAQVLSRRVLERVGGRWLRIG